ncbi:MAG: COX15/CtaA family protein [Myxococcales bacterium]|nr:COX15/CtaA family protein [Myxococcota bacterium]MDW8284062.1 COX15/CtaA family protein [Myxococcales bacterium]
MDRLARYAWIVLGFTLLVIVWGAYVRASGSGAGCGRHWPLCNGAVLPRTPTVATWVELSHRVSSGLALALVLGLWVGARLARPAGHPVRRAATAAVLFMVVEAGIGAALVLLSLVGGDASLRRAVVLALHLLNTFLLLAALALCACWASGGRPPSPRERRVWLVLPALLGTAVVSCAGAVTALGDTLFPARSLAEGLYQDLSPTAHLLIRLRLWHPVLALATGLYLVPAASLLAATLDRTGAALARTAVLLYLAQLGAGVVNLALLAPIWMQLVHLGLADLTWIALVLLAAGVDSRPRAAMVCPA